MVIRDAGVENRTYLVNRYGCCDWTADAANGLKEYMPPSRIYIADEGFEGKE